MIVLVLNCGSSSIKYQVMKMTGAGSSTLLAKGQVERIGLPEGLLTHKPVGGETLETARRISNHTQGIQMIIDAITDPKYGVIESLSQIGAVGHRVAHGGEYFHGSALVNEDVIAKIRNCCELAPLHNPASLEGIMSIAQLLPDVPQVTAFDTSFHQTIPARNFMFAIPYEYYEQYRVRKYGFHGTSHKYVAARGAELAGIDLGASRIITCHIGNGASITAVQNGKSVDTSMGFSPVDGLMMGTRCGNLDPSALLYVMEKENMDTAQAKDLINKRSGVLGITGVSSDMRDIDAAAHSGNERAVLALKMYEGRIRKFIGQYAAEMGGVDMIVFTGGVGENNDKFRRNCCRGLEFMGVQFDEKANEGVRGKDTIISAPDSKVKVAIIATDEERVIASDTYQIVSGLSK
ncbi:MAG: acetate kinase [Alistipes putredinis]|nr:MAG: acetate kinase [Alistipes putredinis]